VYNGANYLRQAVDSILSQTFSDFEIVISDNASTDETAEICREYSRRDKRIKVSRSENFLPQADNVNRAVELCSGEWIKLFCHDDLMLPDCLARIWELAAGCPPELGLIGNGEQWLFPNGYRFPQRDDVSNTQVWHGRTLIRRCLTGKPIPPLPSLTTATVRKKAWISSSRFDSRFAHFDAFLWTRLLLDWDYGFIPQVLTVNRIHSRQVAVSIRKTMRSIEDHRLYWREFVRDSQNVLKLGCVETLMARLKPLGTAGSVLAVEILRGNPGKAAGVFYNTPVSWWLLLPAFVVRSYRREQLKIGTIGEHVPVNEIYP
jgi:glycosyltransferase involved in cell wall biosynthesis